MTFWLKSRPIRRSATCGGVGSSVGGEAIGPCQTSGTARSTPPLFFFAPTLPFAAPQDLNAGAETNICTTRAVWQQVGSGQKQNFGDGQQKTAAVGVQSRGAAGVRRPLCGGGKRTASFSGAINARQSWGRGYVWRPRLIAGTSRRPFRDSFRFEFALYENAVLLHWTSRPAWYLELVDGRPGARDSNASGENFTGRVQVERLRSVDLRLSHLNRGQGTGKGDHTRAQGRAAYCPAPCDGNFALQVSLSGRARRSSQRLCPISKSMPGWGATGTGRGNRHSA